ncbi:deoxynucleoside kinase [Mycoplasma enhydrae]|uniref:deoxynucleoside kinase n=1 Tax=Mycoplasma enhydrae TaxID=2499220 RepID=UPI00197B2A00|nr:deoxynucleoside kinase [Mycoplasma enhydrae]MBN4089492.1 deoxynucleoside kinase [Mycoplasma enhydrae]MCV3733663.1 deoxynucleoside kinase [Mycoplasma enhydrae]
MIIGISGMIAAGKSSLSKKLNDSYPNSLILHEFDENDEVFNTFLKWLYEKKPNLTIGFQSFIIENHSAKFDEIYKELLKKTDHNRHLFLDRFSIEHYIFAKLILKEKEPKYLEAYDALFSKLITKKELPDLVIFLDINFDTFKKRIFERGRKSEIENWDLNYNYFKNLHENYFKLFKELAETYNLNFKILDTNDLNEEEVYNRVVQIIDEEENKCKTKK